MVSIRTATYEVHFNAGGFEAINKHLKDARYSKVFILVDGNTRQHCLPVFMANIKTDHYFEIIEIAAGELHKNISTCTRVWERMSELNADRKSLLINLGGGVVTDLGGFVASAFKRGIAFINVPTSLLSMVDASIGGKTGVDLGKLKNQVGVINQPRMVLVITEFLKTLDRRQLNSGFAEMLKHGLIRDEDYWNALKKRTDFDGMDRLIYDSVIIKNQVVLKDPTEEHLRKILNFGHTLGHAIESHFLESDARPVLLHGEAIASGMILEAYLSHKIAGLDKQALADITNTFLERYQKVEFSPEDITHILSLLKYDKKNTHGNVNFVLLNAIGDPKIDCQVPDEFYEEAFVYYKEQ
ncbi:MAG TPA: 3-dehydroquinate synthase [Eudoraea sp.]|nr:3-dehydroquinate synthase [Eudoraea sp.]